MNIKLINKNTSKTKKQKVFVGLSGGVDSAVGALLLKLATPNNFSKLFGRPTPKGFRGYDVTGVFIKVWQPDFLPCGWREERRDAMRVALALDIPFLFFDFEEEYKKGVAEKMIEEYVQGRTPNPDVLCNREIKFGAFWKKAKELGADFIATGHYARVISQHLSSKKSSDIPTEHGQTFLHKDAAPLPITNYNLLEGRDHEKDQSYFLWTLTQEDFSHTLFPIGHLKKVEVRTLAKKYNLPVAEKKDSQGICFIGEVSMESFLSHYISTCHGDVLNTTGEIIGRHKGALLYTIGERRGFEVTKKKSEDGAFFVVSKNMNDNTITVSNDEQEIRTLSPTKIAIKNVNWINDPRNLQVTARIRYRQEAVPVDILTTDDGSLVVSFMKPARGLSLGQSIVFYSSINSGVDRGYECLGGAIMDKVIE